MKGRTEILTRSTLFVLLSMAIGIFILLGLGTWQVQRLQWKESLIEQVEARMQAEPEPLQRIDMIWQARKDVAWLPVTLEGRFLHDREMYFYTTYKGAVGYEVITPMQLGGGGIVLVSRGFVPDANRDPDTRQEGQVAGQVEITGIARNPLYEKPNRFMPDNEPERRIFYWKDFAQMSALASPVQNGIRQEVVPFMVDLRAPAPAGGLPLASSTRVTFPNNHLQYAITWYGLALALLGVGSWFLYARRREDKNPSTQETG